MGRMVSRNTDGNIVRTEAADVCCVGVSDFALCILKMNLSYLTAEAMKKQDSKFGNTAACQTMYHLCMCYVSPKGYHLGTKTRVGDFLLHKQHSRTTSS